MSDIDVKGSVEALRPLVRQARAALELEKRLDSLVGLDQHKDELSKKVVELKDKVEKAIQAKADAEAAAVRVCSEAKTKADKVLKDASDAAERCIADAEKEAAAIKAEAQAESDKLKADTKAVADTAAELVDQVVALKAQRDALAGDIENLKAVASRIVG